MKESRRNWILENVGLRQLRTDASRTRHTAGGGRGSPGLHPNFAPYICSGDFEIKNNMPKWTLCRKFKLPIGPLFASG